MNINLRPDDSINVRKVQIGRISALILSPKKEIINAPGILWIHGGSYFLGMKEMVYMSRAVDLVKKYSVVVVSPAYTFAGDGEPFYAETVEYIWNLKEAGVLAEIDIYHTDMHAFDMLKPNSPLAQKAIRNFEKHFVKAIEQEDSK